MTKSIFSPEPFPKEFCIFDKNVEQVDSKTLSMSLLLVIISDFERE